MQRKLKLLIVEDETAILTGLVDLFVFHGYEVDSAQDGKQGLEKALVGGYDLIVLDVMLPSLDGFSICNELRKKSREQPIIMLTAKTSDEDIITGLTPKIPAAKVGPTLPPLLPPKILPSLPV